MPMNSAGDGVGSATGGVLAGIAWRTARRAPMQELRAAEVLPARGVAGDFRGRPGDRQVTVLATESWAAACRELELVLPWTTRRANLLVAGVPLTGIAGARLRIGADTELLITGELAPCQRMEEACPGLRQALAPDWRGGVTCRVLAGGQIRVGDPVVLVPPA